MTTRWRHTWGDLKRDVLDTGACTGCSGCVVACPQHVLQLDQRSWMPDLAVDAHVEEDSARCRFGERGCTLCARACPRFGDWETDADTVMWSRVRTADEVLGVYRRVLLVRSTDPEIVDAGQDGGFGTALLAYALEHGYIDTALVSYFDRDMRPVPGVALTREDLLSCAGSRYTYSSNLLALGEALEAGHDKIGLISVGCQTSVPAAARARGANKLAKRFTLVIGLLCSKTFSDHFYEDLLEQEYGVARRSIVKVNIKGRLQVWYDEGESEPSYVEIPLAECREFTRPGCNRCPDFGAEHADISLGGIGKYKAQTLTVVRSELGDELVDAMERDGLVTVVDATVEDPGAIALAERLATAQRKRWMKTPAESTPSHRAPAMLPQSS